jgi:hypothetical protein
MVREARLLGFCRSVCLSGREKGLVLVRSIWRAEVDLMPWEPRFEVTHRRLVHTEELLSNLWGGGRLRADLPSGPQRGGVDVKVIRRTCLKKRRHRTRLKQGRPAGQALWLQASLPSVVYWWDPVAVFHSYRS